MRPRGPPSKRSTSTDAAAPNRWPFGSSAGTGASPWRNRRRDGFAESAIACLPSRAWTMASIFRATSLGVIGFLAFLQVLNIFDIPYQPLLASAGILGVGIGLGAQSIFKDMLNGIFILLEDQYNVGEVVTIAGLKGTVEDLSLRSTRLRDGTSRRAYVNFR